MAPSIETIDNLPTVPPRDRVNKADPTKEDQDKDAFKRALKRKLEQRDDNDETAEDCALIVDIDIADDEKSNSEEAAAGGSDSAPAAGVSSEEDSDDTDSSSGPPEHLDLKA